MESDYKEKYNALICALDSLVWYGCHYDDIKQLIEHIKSSKGYSVCPDFTPKQYDNLVTDVWAMLVCMFGDYGTSPFSGWIERKLDAITFLESISVTSKEAGE